MKIKQQSSLPKCNLEIYTLFLLSEPKLISCVRLSEILEDLSQEAYQFEKTIPQKIYLTNLDT